MITEEKVRGLIAHCRMMDIKCSFYVEMGEHSHQTIYTSDPEGLMDVYNEARAVYYKHRGRNKKIELRIQLNQA